MKKPGISGLILLSFMISGSPSASDRPTCDRASSQPDLGACSYDDLVAAEKEMESVYQEIAQKYASSFLLLERLARAQQSWIKFREDDWKAQFACSEFDTQLCWGPHSSM